MSASRIKGKLIDRKVMKKCYSFSDNETVSSKRPFDKKKWRELKYNKKLKVEAWQERRQKAVMRSYYKDLKKCDIIHNETKSQTRETGKTLSVNAFRTAKDKYRQIKEDKARQKEESKRKRDIINEIRQKDKQIRIEKYKRLSKKTKKGQPVMKERIQMLLEKIQSSLAS